MGRALAAYGLRHATLAEAAVLAGTSLTKFLEAAREAGVLRQYTGPPMG